MINRQINRLGVAGEEKADERHNQQKGADDGPEPHLCITLENQAGRQADCAGSAIVDDPRGQQKVAFLTFVGVAAMGTAIEGVEPVKKRTHFSQRDEEGMLAAFGALEFQGSFQERPKARFGGRRCFG